MAFNEIDDYYFLVQHLDEIELDLVRSRNNVVRLERTGIWVVSGQKAVFEVLDDNPSFGVAGLQKPLGGLSESAITRLAQIPVPSEDHERFSVDLSVLKASTLRSHRLEDLRRMTYASVAKKLDKCFQAGGDLMDDVARVVPAEIVCHMLGVSEGLAAQLTSWAESRAIVTWGVPQGTLEEVHVQNTLDLWSFCQEIGNGRLKLRSGGDLASALAGKASQYAIARVAYWLIFATLIAVPGLIGNVVTERLMRFDLASGRVEGPATRPEMCRNTSIVTTQRSALRATTVNQVAIPSGDRVLVLLRSAGIGRGSRGRIAMFGVGEHSCLGAALATMQLNVVLDCMQMFWSSMQVRDRRRIEFTRTIATKWPVALPVPVVRNR